MSDEQGSLKRRLCDYIVRRQREGDSGKTFLFGIRHDAPVFCVAAGIGDDAGQRHFVTLGRYLLQDRFTCQDYAVGWPAQLGDSDVYVIDVVWAGRLVRWLLGDKGVYDEKPEAEGLAGALRQSSRPLPAILRRDLDGLFESFRLPLPGED